MYLYAVVSVGIFHALAKRTPRLKEDVLLKVVQMEDLSLPALWAETSMLAKEKLDVSR